MDEPDEDWVRDELRLYGLMRGLDVSHRNGILLVEIGWDSAAFVHNVLAMLDIEGPVHHTRADATKG